MAVRMQRPRSFSDDDPMSQPTSGLHVVNSYFDQGREVTEDFQVTSTPQSERSKWPWSVSPDEKESPPDGSDENGEKVRTKLICMWNNVKYSWSIKAKTTFSRDSPLWLLGRIYHQNIKSELTSSLVQSNFDAFLKDFSSRIWLTYRKEFPMLTGSYYTSDCGWGCMLRSGQMLLAQALICHFLGRDWRWEPVKENLGEKELLQESLHRSVVQWFGDSPSPACPLSIHQMVVQGKESGKRAGDWYGPASVSHIIKKVTERAVDTHPELDTLRVYVAQDCTIYLEDVQQSCSGSAVQETDFEVVDEMRGKPWKSLILLIPLRLGGEELNPIYIPCLKGLLSLEQCIGIIGGRPKHSLYFLGWQDDFLIHMDPHQCQEMVDVLAPSFPLKTFHCKDARKMPFGRMDPSCCIGFYLRTQKEFDDFRDAVQAYLIPHKSKGDYPIFAFSQGRAESLYRFPVSSLSVCQDIAQEYEFL